MDKCPGCLNDNKLIIHVEYEHGKKLDYCSNNCASNSRAAIVSELEELKYLQDKKYLKNKVSLIAVVAIICVIVVTILIAN